MEEGVEFIKTNRITMPPSKIISDISESDAAKQTISKQERVLKGLANKQLQTKKKIATAANNEYVLASLNTKKKTQEKIVKQERVLKVMSKIQLQKNLKTSTVTKNEHDSASLNKSFLKPPEPVITDSVVESHVHPKALLAQNSSYPPQSMAEQNLSVAEKSNALKCFKMIELTPLLTPRFASKSVTATQVQPEPIIAEQQNTNNIQTNKYNQSSINDYADSIIKLLKQLQENHKRPMIQAVAENVSQFPENQSVECTDFIEENDISHENTNKIIVELKESQFIECTDSIAENPTKNDICHDSTNEIIEELTERQFVECIDSIAEQPIDNDGFHNTNNLVIEELEECDSEIDETQLEDDLNQEEVPYCKNCDNSDYSSTSSESDVYDIDKLSHEDCKVF